MVHELFAAWGAYFLLSSGRAPVGQFRNETVLYERGFLPAVVG